LSSDGNLTTKDTLNSSNIFANVSSNFVAKNNGKVIDRSLRTAANDKRAFLKEHLEFADKNFRGINLQEKINSIEEFSTEDINEFISSKFGNINLTDNNLPNVSAKRQNPKLPSWMERTDRKSLANDIADGKENIKNSFVERDEINPRDYINSLKNKEAVQTKTEAAKQVDFETQMQQMIDDEKTKNFYLSKLAAEEQKQLEAVEKVFGTKFTNKPPNWVEGECQ